MWFENLWTSGSGPALNPYTKISNNWGRVTSPLYTSMLNAVASVVMAVL